MDRRKYVSTVLAAGMIAGCVNAGPFGASSDDKNNTTSIEQNCSSAIQSNGKSETNESLSTGVPCDELDHLYPDNVTHDSLEPANDFFKLSLSDRSVAVGDNLCVELINTTDSMQTTSVKEKYTIQHVDDGEWISNILYSHPDWHTGAKPHEPGNGYSWHFIVSVDGFSKDHVFCDDLTPGTYRFVYWGTGPIGATFEVTG